ncbi:MAG: response regulator [Oligoflexia bacterium]|nr:response regulator [Oligoflexia bacterium]
MDNVSWFGICHGWAPATVKEKEPHECSMSVNSSFGNITLPIASSDMNGLASLLYAEFDNKPESAGGGCGDRCDISYTDDKGNKRFKDPSYKDINPGALFVILGNVDVHNCIIETLNILEKIYKTENIILETNLQAHNYFVKANVGKIQQVFMNIISNARDALNSKHGGQITIFTKNVIDDNKEEYLIVNISDNGTGISKEVIPKIFDPFFTTKGPGQGTGLGLSICHTIVSSFGGTITVESKEEAGSSFEIMLPITKNNEILVSENKVKQETKITPFQGKVLVVDDEEGVRRTLGLIISSLGLTVLEAEDGEIAYQMMKEENYDYLITDIKMPEMSGNKLIEKIRSENIAKNTKFIVITGGIIDKDNFDLQVDWYIEKPFNREDIFNMFKSLVS